MWAIFGTGGLFCIEQARKIIVDSRRIRANPEELARLHFLVIFTCTCDRRGMYVYLGRWGRNSDVQVSKSKHGIAPGWRAAAHRGPRSGQRQGSTVQWHTTKRMGHCGVPQHARRMDGNGMQRSLQTLESGSIC
jgi:hypothetical protein